MKRPIIKQMIAEFDEYTPQLPKGFKEWTTRELKKRNRMMFYKKTRKKVVALCSACGSIQHPSKIEHNKEIRCSSCKKKAIAKSINKATRYQARDFFTIAQPFKTKEEVGIIVRYFSLSLEYKRNQGETKNFPEEILDKLTDPKVGDLWEGSRVYLVKSKVSGKQFVIDAEQDWIEEKGNNGKTSCELKWVVERKRHVMFNKELLRYKDAIVYKKNLKSIERDEYKYSALSQFKRDRFHIEEYLLTYNEYKETEMLCKLGYFKIIEELMTSWVYKGYYGRPVKALQDIKRMDKNVLKAARENDWGTKEIEFYTKLQDKKITLTIDEYKWIFENINYRGRLIESIEYAPISKTIKYLRKQPGEKQDALITWTDYLPQCEILNHDLNDDYHLFPKNLNERHKTYTDQIKAQRSTLFSKRIRDQHTKWAPILDWKYGSYEIKVAKTGAQLVKEGKELKHCVGGGSYHKRIAEGKSLILLIRKDGKPHYTLELDFRNMSVLQLQGERHSKSTEEVKKLVERWLQKVRQEMMQSTKSIKEAV